MGISRGHVAWLAVWFIAVNVYTLRFIFYMVYDYHQGVAAMPAFFLQYYTLPLIGLYVGGLGLGWLAPRLVRWVARASRKLDEAALGI